jgi:hypothetical protein
VNLEAIARVGKPGYSVPARWAGRRPRARISETTIAFYKGTDRVAEVERHRGSQGVYVDWRHVLPQLYAGRELYDPRTGISQRRSRQPQR